MRISAICIWKSLEMLINLLITIGAFPISQECLQWETYRFFFAKMGYCDLRESFSPVKQIHIHKCTYVHKHIHTYICIPVYMCMYACLNVCVDMHVCMCAHVCMCVHVWISMCGCACVHACVCVHVCGLGGGRRLTQEGRNSPSLPPCPQPLPFLQSLACVLC